MEEVAEELRQILVTMDYPVSEDNLMFLATMLYDRRGEDVYGFGCLSRGGSGVITWLKSRMHDLDLLPPCRGTYALADGMVTATLHFEAWDVERYGEWDECWRPTQQEVNRSAIQRSPLSRLRDASPINRTARKIAMRSDQRCAYCNKHFRNPAALILHLQSVHSQELSVLG